MTQSKRATTVVPSNNVDLAPHLPFNCDSKEAFFANTTNTQAFINMLSKAMEDKGIQVFHTKDDADQLIAKKSIECAVYYPTQVISEDTDIFNY